MYKVIVLLLVRVWEKEGERERLYNKVSTVIIEGESPIIFSLKTRDPGKPVV